MKLTFLGTGTSTGIPMVGCSCAVCCSTDPRNKRRRVSVLLQNDQSSWLIDAGPDFRVQALDAGLSLLDAVFLTHPHADHILGLDDLRPLSWKRPIPVFADRSTTNAVRKAFPYLFEEGDGKTSRPRLEFHSLQAGESVTSSGLSVLPLAIQHGDASILAFKVGAMAYLTDCSGIPPETLAQLRNLDVLIIDALRYRPHPTHFSLEQAVETAKTIGARCTYFVHMTHDVDHETWAKTLPATMSPAYDGLVIEY